ncbi:MAG: Threonine dehydrogenase and related Zn-dependent dehydrogenases, partial [uncultured Actinomycetospora sp.]
EGTGVPRSRQQGLGGRPGRPGAGADRRRGQGRHHHDLRHRPPHPAGRRGRRDRRPHPRPRGGRDDHRGRRRRPRLLGRRPRARPGDHQVRPLRVLPARDALPLPDRRRHRLDLRPPHRRHAGRARARPLRRHLALRGADGGQQRAGDLPRRLAAHRLRGRRARRRRAPGQHRRRGRRRRGRAVRGADDGPVGRVEGHRDRLEQVPPGEGARVRRHRHRRGRPGHGRRRHRPHRRARRRRRHRGRRLPGDPADRGLARPARRDDRQRRRARDAGRAADAGHVDQQRHADHGPRRHRVHPDPAQDGRLRPHPGREDGHAHLHLRPDGRGLPGLRRRGGQPRPQGGHHAL